MKYHGGCHCGAIGIEFETAIDPAAIEVRACQCGFCRKHNGLAVSDPAGRVTIRILDSTNCSPYEFGLRTAEYLICCRCGVYVAAITVEEPKRAIVILNALEDAALFTQPPRAVDYDAETRADRIARRHRNWTPASLVGTS